MTRLLLATRSTPPSSRAPALALGALLLCAALAALWPAAALAADPEPVQEGTFRAWEQKMRAYFDAHPELKTRREEGTGWEPYNRIKWFNEQRLFNGEDVPLFARWRVWERKRAIEREMLASGKQAVASWFSLGPTNLAGRILALEFDPLDANVLYAGGADGGVWRSTNGGVSWTPLSDELPAIAVNTVAVAQFNSNTIVLGTGEATNNIDRVGGFGIVRSTDYGATWALASIDTSGSWGDNGFHAMDVNPFDGTMIAAANDGIYRSTDDGASWTRVRLGKYSDVVYKPGSADTVYAIKLNSGVDPGNSVRMSTDNGLTWPRRSSGLPTLDWGKSKLAVTPANPEYLYLVITAETTYGLEGLYRSTNSGASWTLQANSPNIIGGQGWYNLSLAADPNNADRIICGGTPLWRSTDGGVNFTQIGSGVHVDHHAIAYRPGTTDNVFVGTDGGIWESTNDGTSWSDRNSGLVTYQFYDICVSQPDPLFSMGGTQDQGTDRWTGSTTWSQGLGADGMVCNCDGSNSLRVYGEIQFGEHYVSNNGGVNWIWINNGLPGSGDWVTPTDLDFNNGLRVYSATVNPVGVHRTLDGGLNWITVDGDGATWISISPVIGGPVWAVWGPNVRYTTDEGTTWVPCSAFGFPVSSPTKIFAHPTDPNAAFVTFSSYSDVAHIARTTDLGVTWQDVTGDFVDQPVNGIAVDPQNPTHWFIGTDVGVWATTTEGQAWAPYEVGLPNAVVADVEIQNSSRKLRAGTHGRGMWEIDISAPSTGVPATAQAIDLMFDEPFPNPVVGGTVFRYAARTPGNLRLAVYDVAGRLVSVVAEHPADGIIRTVRWDTRDVADGVYFARLVSGGQEKTQKVVVVK